MPTPQAARSATSTVDMPGLTNLRHPAPGFLTGGQPGAAQLAAAAHTGLRRVINLRAAGEDAGFDEAAQVAGLGIQYCCVAIAGPQDLTREKVRALDALLTRTDCGPTLVHCASGARVGALMALRAGWLQGKPAAEALAIGRTWGLLPKLEPIVTQLLA